MHQRNQQSPQKETVGALFLNCLNADSDQIGMKHAGKRVHKLNPSQIQLPKVFQAKAPLRRPAWKSSVQPLEAHRAQGANRGVHNVFLNIFFGTTKSILMLMANIGVEDRQ